MKTHLSFALLSLVFCASFLLAGCGGGSSLTLTQENFDKIHDDMSPADVRGILGDPSQSTTDPIPVIGGTQTTYVYENSTARVTIIFKNDLVKEKHSDFQNAAVTPTPVPTTAP